MVLHKYHQSVWGESTHGIRGIQVSSEEAFSHLRSPRFLFDEALAHLDMITCILSSRRPVNNGSCHYCNESPS